MARFIATGGTYFEPLSYDEMARSLDYAQERHDAAADAYANLSMETSALEKYITENEDDERARALYDNYMTKLKTLQDNLWTNGISSTTKRELSEARNLYASDIARIQKAVTDRQERSKEFWKAKHEHPDLITGSDPGLSGLDKYLDDDNYGLNYYQYSGNDFANQVGIEAKSVAQEIRRDMLYNGKSVPGYITRLIQRGATSEEVQRAYDAVQSFVFSPEQGDRATAFDGLDDVSKILANVLMTNLESTGALDKKNDVSQEELQRMLPFGKVGLTQSIIAPELKDFEDKIYDHNLRMQEAAIKSGNRSGSISPESSMPGYDFNTIISNLTNPGYEDYAKTAAPAAEKYVNGPINVITPDGKTVSVADPWQMSELIYNPEIRKKTRAQFGGLDVALPESDFFGTTDSRQHGVVRGKDGSSIDLYTYKLSKKDAEELGLQEGDIALCYAKGKIHKDATIRFNNARHEYFDYVDSMKKANEELGLDFDELAYSPTKQEKKFREDNNIPATVDTSDLRSVVSTKNYTGDYAPAVLVGTDSGFNKARENFGNAIFSTYHNAKSNGAVSKGSRFAFYKVTDGGVSVKAKGETDIKKVFGDNPNAANIDTISIFPQDLTHTEDGILRPMFRVTSTASPDDVWAADVIMLGTQVYNRILAVNPNTGMNVAQMTEDMMYPIQHPEQVMSWSEQESNEWGARMYTYLTRSGLPASYVNSMIAPPTKRMFNQDSNSFSVAGISAKDVVRSSTLQSQLYGSIVNYINAYLQTAENVNTLNGVRYRSDSSDKASTYID